MKKKILHVLNSSAYAGAENVVITIIKQMKEKYDCIYVTKAGTIIKRLDQEDIPYLVVDKISISEIRRVIGTCQPDLIHAHDFTASIICGFTVKGIPVISHLHNNSPWLKTYHPYSFIYLFSSLKFASILMVSDSVMNEYVFGKYIKSKCKVIGNPITLDRVRELGNICYDGTCYDIVFLGRLSKQKNPQRFIRLMKEVSKFGVNLKCAMIGQGDLLEECLELIDELKLKNTIEVLGFLDNPYSILKHSKLLCITSDWEGFGMVAVEALAVGIPVVANDVGGLSGIVDGGCGKLCYSDSDFINEMVELLLDKDYIGTKKKNAIRKSNELENIGQYISCMDGVYIDIWDREKK